MYFMADSGEFTVACGAQAQLLLCTRTRADHTKHLRALRHQFHGTLYLLCCQRSKHHWGPGLTFRAKTSAHKQSNHTHIVFRNAEHFCHVTAPIADSLLCVMQRKFVAIPLRDCRVHLRSEEHTSEL